MIYNSQIRQAPRDLHPLDYAHAGRTKGSQIFVNQIFGYIDKITYFSATTQQKYILSI